MKHLLSVLGFIVLAPWAGFCQTTLPLGINLLAHDGNYYGAYDAYFYSYSPTTSSTNAVAIPNMEELTLCLERSNGTLLGIGINASGNSYLLSFTLSGEVTTLAKFAGATDSPVCPALASDGNYYGSATQGGANGHGYLYQLTSAGALNDFYNFTGTGTNVAPAATPLQGSDGNLYYPGSAALLRYGASTGLTIFPLDFSFGQGSSVNPPMVEGPDGNFYAITLNSPLSTVAKITPAGVASTIYTSQDTSGEDVPLGGVYATGSQLAVLQNYVDDIDTTYCYMQGAYSAMYSFSTGGIVANNPLFTLGNPLINSGGEVLDSVTTGGGFLTGNGFYGIDQGFTTTYAGGPACGGDTIPAYFFNYSLPADATPITMTLSKTHVLPGGAATLTWSVNNAFSDTLKQCFGSGALSGKVALSGSTTVTAPETAGNYVTSIVCGGTETSNATLAVGPPNLEFGVSGGSQFGIGSTVQLNAIVTNPGSDAPTGTVDFMVGSTVIGSAPLVNNEATFSASSSGVPAGTYSVYARYLGDGNYSPVSSETVAITLVSKTSSNVAVSPASQTIAVGGGMASFGILVNGKGAYTNSYPTGTVSLMSGSTVVATAKLTPDLPTQSNGYISLSDAGYNAGTYTFVVSYPGDSFNLPAVSSPVTVTISAESVRPSPGPK